MAELIQNEYNSDSIKTLEGLEHIRTRPGMYIGRLGDGKSQDDGIYVLLKEIMDNSIDEFGEGYGKQIRVDITSEDGSDRLTTVTVRDYGRGIPLEKLVDAISILNTSGKFKDSKVFKKSIGLNGVGSKAVNALSSSFYAETFRDGESAWASFSRGKLLDSGRRSGLNENNGTLIRFTPDIAMFEDFQFEMAYVETMVKNYAYLKKGLNFILNGVSYKSKNGLLDMINERIGEEALYPPIHLEGTDIEVVFTHTNSYGENISSFVNGQNTREGGTHLAGFKDAVAKVLKNYFVKKNFTSEDCRQGIVGAVSIQIQEPNFQGQAKTKLGNTYMWGEYGSNGEGETVVERGPSISSYINNFLAKNLDDFLRQNTQIANEIEKKLTASMQDRQEIASIRKKSSSKKGFIYNKKLKDCRYHFSDKLPQTKAHFADESSIFITEGDSASGTINKVRNPETQAVFSLRGKSINSVKESHRKVAENEELKLLVGALGVEESVDNLRYNRIVIATDADDDGMHIRLLVLSFLLKYYPELVLGGHVYVLQTPLFRVRGKSKSKENSRYCYTTNEKLSAIKHFGSTATITRFKGLGEISPEEFKNFIGEDMRLDRVEISPEESANEILEFYMGDNTSYRQKFIRKNLRSEKDLEDVNI